MGDAASDAAVAVADASPDATVTADANVNGDQDADGNSDGSAVGAARLTLNKAEAAFATISGCSGPGVSFRVTNEGQVASGPLSVAVGDPFKVTVDGCSGQRLEAGRSCDLEVSFEAVVNGQRSSALIVMAQPGGRAEARLLGTAVDGGVLVITPNSASFRPTLVGQTSAVTTFSARNVGGRDLVFETAAVGTSDFAIVADRCSGTSVKGGATCEIDVVFRPPSVGQKSALLTLTARSCTGVTAIAELKGLGAPATTPLTIDKDLKDFGSVSAPCSSEPSSFHIANTGSGAVISPGTEVGGPFEIVSDTCGGVTLAPGGSCDVSVKYVPRAVGTHEGWLAVSGMTDPSSSLAVISATLRGAGVPQMNPSFTPASHDFGTALVDQRSAPFELTLTNPPGGLTGTFTMGLDGAAAGDFEVVSTTCDLPVAAGASCKVQVVFTPKATGARKTTLLAGGAACGNGSGVAQLSGTGR
jgi:hypothetical protein